MNKQLSNFIGKNCGTLPVVMYQYTCPAIGDIQEAFKKGELKNFKPVILENKVNHKRRIKRALTRLLKINPRIQTIEHKQMAASIVMQQYQRQLFGKIKPREVEPSVKEALDHIINPNKNGTETE